MGPRPQAGGGEIETDTVEKKTPDTDFQAASRAFLQDEGG